MIKALLRLYFFRFLILFSIVFLQLWWNARSYDYLLTHAIQQMTAPMTAAKATAPATPIMT